MLKTFAKMLGIEEHDAEEAIRSERAAKHTLSRRSFFGLSAAMSAGTLFSFGVETPVEMPIWYFPNGPAAAEDAPIYWQVPGVDRATLRLARAILLRDGPRSFLPATTLPADICDQIIQKMFDGLFTPENGSGF